MIDEFDKLFPGLSEKIFEQFYGDADHGILIWDKEQLDREGINWTFCAEVILHGRHIYVSCQDGNWGGSEIISFDIENICDIVQVQPMLLDRNKCPVCGEKLIDLFTSINVCPNSCDKVKA